MSEELTWRPTNASIRFAASTSESSSSASTSASFSEISGLTVDGDVVDYREGTDTSQPRAQAAGAAQVQQPDAQARLHAGRPRCGSGTTRIANGADERYGGSIVLMNEAHAAVMRWNFDNAWINKIDGPPLKAIGQRGRHRVDGAGARRPDARTRDLRADVERSLAPGRALRGQRRRTRAAAGAAHRRRGLRRRGRARAAGHAGAGGVDAAVQQRLRRLHRRRLPGLRGARVLRERRPAAVGRARRASRLRHRRAAAELRAAGAGGAGRRGRTAGAAARGIVAGQLGQCADAAMVVSPVRWSPTACRAASTPIATRVLVDRRLRRQRTGAHRARRDGAAPCDRAGRRADAHAALGAPRPAAAPPERPGAVRRRPDAAAAHRAHRLCTGAARTRAGGGQLQRPAPGGAPPALHHRTAARAVLLRAVADRRQRLRAAPAAAAVVASFAGRQARCRCHWR